MAWWQDVMVVVAGVLAGMINTVVGSGTLITFPVLIGLGVPPVTANISNSIGLVPGGAAGAWGYRAELAGQRARVLRLGVAALLGGAGGAVLLLLLPASAFTRVAPILVGVSVVLVVIQPWLKRRLAARRSADGEHGGLALWGGILVTAVYGGYFGAAQGVIFLALMGILLAEPLQRVNAVKNVLAVIVKSVAAVVFIIVGGADWFVVGLLALGTIAGGLIGARIGRKLPPVVLRGVIVVIGVAAIVKLLL